MRGCKDCRDLRRLHWAPDCLHAVPGAGSRCGDAARFCSRSSSLCPSGFYRALVDVAVVDATGAGEAGPE